MKKIILMVAACFLTYGCSGFTPNSQFNAAGQSTYRYHKTAEGECTVMITSGKDVSNASFNIDKDCSLKADGKVITGLEQQQKILNIVGDAINRVPLP